MQVTFLHKFCLTCHFVLCWSKIQQVWNNMKAKYYMPYTSGVKNNRRNKCSVFIPLKNRKQKTHQKMTFAFPYFVFVFWCRCKDSHMRLRGFETHGHQLNAFHSTTSLYKDRPLELITEACLASVHSFLFARGRMPFIKITTAHLMHMEMKLPPVPIQRPACPL